MWAVMINCKLICLTLATLLRSKASSMSSYLFSITSWYYCKQLEPVNIRSVNSMAALKLHSDLFYRGSIQPWGVQYILSGRTGNVSPGSIFLTDRFSSATGVIGKPVPRKDTFSQDILSYWTTIPRIKCPAGQEYLFYPRKMFSIYTSSISSHICWENESYRYIASQQEHPD